MRALKLIPTQTLAVLAIDFLLVAAIYSALGSFVSGVGGSEYLVDLGGWLPVVLATGSVLFGIYFNELYADLNVGSRVALVLQLSNSFGVSLVIQTLIAYVDSDIAVPRRVMLFGTILSFPTILLWRIFYSGVLWRLVGRQAVLIVGSGSLAQDIAKQIVRRPERGFQVVGYSGFAVSEEKMVAAYLGPFDELETLTKEWKPDRLVVACSDRRDGGMPVDELLKIRRRGLHIEEGSVFYELLTGRVCGSEFRPAEFIFDQTLIHRPGSLALQSIYMNLLALAGIILLSPILFVLAILVKISTGGPVFDPVPSIGYRGIPFTRQRFRTTRISAGGDSLAPTKIGNLLRRSRMELLPALINLMRGEMALVGPRPVRPEVSAELTARIPFYEQRFALKPGVTGWSQINIDPTDTSADALTALEFDLYYLKHISLSLDAFILLHRVRQLLTIPV